MVPIPAGDAKAFRRLANERALTELKDLSERGWEFLAAWYADGFVHVRRAI
jgi:hypothetical protein